MIPLLEIHDNRDNTTPEKQDSNSTKLNVAWKKKLNTYTSKNIKAEKPLQVSIYEILIFNSIWSLKGNFIDYNISIIY